MPGYIVTMDFPLTKSDFKLAFSKHKPKKSPCIYGLSNEMKTLENVYKKKPLDTIKLSRTT